MPAYTATAPGKVILFGEHAVVYGRPAIAAPVSQVRARAVVSPAPRGPAGEVLVLAPDIGLESRLADLPEDHPLACVVNTLLAALQVSQPPACTLRVTSTIPVAAGLGSGAAVSVAILRAFSAFLGSPLDDEEVSALAYEVEKLYHGTPSGIDNTVITYGMPVYFVRGRQIQTLRLPCPFTLVIGDTGVAGPTAVAVGDVRRGWQASPADYEALFDRVGQIAEAARLAIEAGQVDELGPLMDENQAMLKRMGVSSPELERLVLAARRAGALGAKLSGGGGGGNMIALTEGENAPEIARALLEGGAVRAITTTIGAPAHA
jgi:mevalonate kinase